MAYRYGEIKGVIESICHAKSEAASGEVLNRAYRHNNSLRDSIYDQSSNFDIELVLVLKVQKSAEDFVLIRRCRQLLCQDFLDRE